MLTCLKTTQQEMTNFTIWLLIESDWLMFSYVPECSKQLHAPPDRGWTKYRVKFADLCWWHTFLPAWNGVFVLPPQSQPSACFASNASGQWGCGATWDAQWFQLRWPQSAMTDHISFLELVVVLMACAVWGPMWGPMWRGRTVLCWCDNQAAVCAIAARSCRDAKMMHLTPLFVFP